MTSQLRKAPVRWSDSDIDQVWNALPDVMAKNRRRGLTWQIEHAGQQALGPERWRRIPSFAAIPSILLSRIAERYPELKRIYPQLENVNKLPIDKETFINLVVETRLNQPFTDFVDIWNECIALVPELELPEVTHSKYIDPDLCNLIQKQCEAWLQPEPEIEPEPVQPKLDELPAVALLTAYHEALVREMTARFVGKPVAEIDREVPVSASQNPAPASLKSVAASASAPASQSGLKNLRDIPDKEDAPDTCGREKIRVSVVDHNVSRSPVDFERGYDKNPQWKFKFFFTAIGSKDVPMFKQGGFAIISESAPLSWKNQAMSTCGRESVFVINGSREAVHESMKRITTILERKRAATVSNGRN